MNTRKRNALFGRYPCCDMVNNAIRHILDGHTDSAIEELLQAIWKADGYLHEDLTHRVYEIHERVRETRPNPWHTGTPTEEGEYLCWVVFPKDICRDPECSWKCMWKDGKWYDNQYEGKLLMIEDLGAKIIAWQKIDPYRKEAI